MTDQNRRHDSINPVTILYLKNDGALYQRCFALLAEREGDFLVAGKNGKAFSFKKRVNLAVLPGWKHEATGLALAEQKLRQAVAVQSRPREQEKTSPAVAPQRQHPANKLPAPIPEATEELVRRAAMQKLNRKKLERGRRDIEGRVR